MKRIIWNKKKFLINIIKLIGLLGAGLLAIIFVYILMMMVAVGEQVIFELF